MPSRVRQLLRRFIARAGTSVAGDGILERAQAVTFALLGLAAAVGLTLVALLARQGWSSFPDIPIPALSTEHAAVHRAIAARATPLEGAGRGQLEKGSPAPPLSGGEAASGRLRSHGSHRAVALGLPDVAGGRSAGGAPRGAKTVGQPPPTAPTPAPAPRSVPVASPPAQQNPPAESEHGNGGGSSRAASSHGERHGQGDGALASQENSDETDGSPASGDGPASAGADHSGEAESGKAESPPRGHAHGLADQQPGRDAPGQPHGHGYGHSK